MVVSGKTDYDQMALASLGVNKKIKNKLNFSLTYYYKTPPTDFNLWEGFYLGNQTF